MSRGGCRYGAGRKRGVGNLLTEGLREKIKPLVLINFLQDIVKGKIEGASVSERKDAAVALLRKILPDMSQQKIEAEIETFKPISFGDKHDEE